MRLFHILDRGVWAAAAEAGQYCPPSLASEGFVHCSYAGQVATTANLIFAGRVGLCVVELDPNRLDAEVRVEDSYGSGTAFPHVYGPVPAGALVAVHDLVRDDDGVFSFDPAGCASRGR
jgi:uncharacterized protein (DUF952 family)